MTYSVVARDPDSGAFGVAAASRFFAVGALVPHMDGKVGAIATQAFVNPLYGTIGLELLRCGKSAQAVLDEVIEPDRGQSSRQLHLIDNKGRNAAYTGGNCIDYAGHIIAENVSVAGNMLVNRTVLEATLAAYQSNMSAPFEERMLTAMEAGEEAGGDKRGKQSAALRIVRGESYPSLDLRADDHADPLAELWRLLCVAKERFVHFAELLPTSENPSGSLDRTEIDQKIEALDHARQLKGQKSASYASPPTEFTPS